MGDEVGGERQAAGQGLQVGLLCRVVGVDGQARGEVGQGTERCGPAVADPTAGQLADILARLPAPYAFARGIGLSRTWASNRSWNSADVALADRRATAADLDVFTGLQVAAECGLGEVGLRL